MTENNDEKKTLTLKSPTLGLKKNIDESMIRQNISAGGKNLTVMKKKRVFSSPVASGEGIINSDENFASPGSTNKRVLTNNEMASRVNAIRVAAQETERKQQQQLLQEETREQEQELPLESVSIDILEATDTETTESASDIIASDQVNPDEKEEQKSKEKFEKIKTSDIDELEDAESKKGKSELKSKGKVSEERRVANKIVAHAIVDEEDVEGKFGRSSYRKKDKRKKNFKPEAEKLHREVILPENISVAELSNRMSEKSSAVIKELMKLGLMITANQVIDADTAEIVIESLGHKCRRVSGSDIEKVLEFNDAPGDLVKRPPVVTIMGHVDHGKTSLLDALRLTDVVSREAGGITQHIGAYQVRLESNEKITFIDTPGHEAFTAMRSRGAKATDIVVLVVAADDGIKAQTEEAISHAKAAEVPIIVAINKIDKPEANPLKVKNELLIHGLVPEDLGGDIVVVEVSAKQKLNLDKLEEAILLVAEMLELKSNPTAPAAGIIVEAKVDKARGPIATFLVQRGTLKVGDIVVAGDTFGKVKVINDDKNVRHEQAGPSSPVEVLGLESAPSAGDVFNVVDSEKTARDICDYRINKRKESNVVRHNKASLTQLFSKAGESVNLKQLTAIIKGDVQGSVEAIIGTLSKLSNEEVEVRVIHSGVGGINESDIALASASGAIVVGFNVRANAQAIELANRENVSVRYYSIIYNLVDDFKAVMGGMLSPIIREEYIGSVEIRQVFNITKVGKVAGCMVTKGTVKRGAGVRLLRDNIVIHEGKLKTLKRFKDEVKEVKEGYECGLAFENYDNLKEGDFVEVFEVVEEQRQL
jgi:translation initiation factor IF-2